MDEAKRRLTNIKTKELSLVDEGANNKQFIIMKRKGQIMGKKDSELLKGKGEVVLAPSVKKSLLEQCVEITNKTKAFSEYVEKLGESEEANDEIPEEVLKQFDQVADVLPQYEDDDFGISKAAKEIEKAGKKIASNRLEKMTEAAEILNKLIEELTGSPVSKTTSSETGHAGGAKMTTEVKKRSLENDFKVAEVDLIKAREELDDATEKADAEAIEKAKKSVEEAEKSLNEIKKAKDEADKQAEIEKAEKAKKEAEEALAKAKGEVTSNESDLAKSLQAINEKMTELSKMKEDVSKMREDLEKKIEDVKKTATPSNTADENEDEINKGKEKQQEESIFKGVF